MRKVLFASVLSLVVAVSIAQAGEPETVTKFAGDRNACHEYISTVMTGTGLKPLVIADTKLVYMVKFTANDGGSILVTCSTPDQIVLVTATR